MMGFDRSIGPDRAQRLQVSNEELARMVAKLGETVRVLTDEVQVLTDRVKVLGAAQARLRRNDAARRACKARAAERALRDRLMAQAAQVPSDAPEAPPVSIAQIVSDVAAASGVEVTVILGRSRAREATYARQEVYMRAREAGYSYPKIAHEMGRDHGTIICGVKSVRMRRAVAARRKAVADA